MSGKLSVGRDLNLHDPLRLKQAEFSARTLWLGRVTANEGTVEQIDKRLVDAFGDLLAAGIGDMRELTRIVGSSKLIKFDTFRGHRAGLPVGGWASNIKLGAMRAKVADDVLTNPGDWPGDLVQRAVEEVEERMSAGLKPVGEVATASNWFPEA